MGISLQLNGSIEERIEAFVSGLCWAEELNCNLEVWWWFFPQGIPCSFFQCFDPRSLPSWLTIREGRIEDAPFIRSEQDFIEKGYPTVLQSRWRFYQKDPIKWMSFLKILQPSQAIGQGLSMLPSRGSVGIYIHKCKENPIARVLAEIWQNHRKATHFFVSTDSSEVKRFLELMFKERVFFSNPHTFSQSPKYIVDSLRDFFAFSLCSFIINCSNTTLCELSATRANVQLLHL